MNKKEYDTSYSDENIPDSFNKIQNCSMCENFGTVAVDGASGEYGIMTFPQHVCEKYKFELGYMELSEYKCDKWKQK